MPLGVRSHTRLFGSSHDYNHCNDNTQMRRHLATLTLSAPARAVAVDATVNVKATVDNTHTISVNIRQTLVRRLVPERCALLESSEPLGQLRYQRLHVQTVPSVPTPT